MPSDLKRGAITTIAAENRAAYGSPDGRAFLRTLDLSFEERWTYLIELLQNAIDARATRIRMEVGEDELVFEHDGAEPLEESSVRAMSKLFQSTKGVATIGFMGIGLKSVFRRFRYMGVAGFDWSFAFKLPFTTGSRFGDQQLDLLGAVIPTWDESLSQPEEPFTTRFVLRHLLRDSHPLSDDVEATLPKDDVTVLAVLAHRGLKSLRLGSEEWRLSTEREGASTRASAERGSTHHYWRLFIQQYSPSNAAVARLLERRRVQPNQLDEDRVYEVAQRSREVVCIVPVDVKDKPNSTSAGRIFATLPTEATWPVRMHLQADWIVNLSRSGIPELDDNEWQEDIVDQIPGTIRAYLEWLTVVHRDNNAGLRAGFSAIRLPDRSRPTRLDAAMSRPQWRDRFAKALGDLAFVPAYVAGRLTMQKPRECLLLPRALAQLGNSAELYPDVLFGVPCVAEDLLTPEVASLLDDLGLVSKLSASHLAQTWPKGLSKWWERLNRSETEKAETLVTLWSHIAQLTVIEPEWSVLPSVRTQAGTWVPPAHVTFIQGLDERDHDNVDGRLIAAIAAQIPLPERLVERSVLQALHAKTRPSDDSRKRALEFLLSRCQRLKIDDLIAATFAECVAAGDRPHSFLLLVAHWARRQKRTGLVTHVVTADGAEYSTTNEAIVAEPFSEHGQVRRALWPTRQAIASAYVNDDPYKGTADDWRAFFESCGCLGPLRVLTRDYPVGRWMKADAAKLTGLKEADLPQTNDTGYVVRDYDFDESFDTSEPALIAAWLEGEFSKLAGRGRRELKASYYSSSSQIAPRPASWVEQLQETSWVPTTLDTLACAADVLARPDPSREDAPVARLSAALTHQLLNEGVRFGHNVPAAPAILQLQKLAGELSPADMAAKLGDLLSSDMDDAGRVELQRVLLGLVVPTTSGKRHPFIRLVRRLAPRGRSALGGWIVSTDDIPEPLRAILIRDDLPLVVPDTTTASHALGFLEDVWKRARSHEQGLADEVRRQMPIAYSYVTEGLANDGDVKRKWPDSVQRRMVHASGLAGRRWVAVADTPVPIWDDLREPWMRQFVAQNEYLVTASHLGENSDQQRAVSEALGLRLLSAVLRPTWTRGAERLKPTWKDRFTIVQQLFQHAADSEAPKAFLVLRVLDSLSVVVRGMRHNIAASVGGTVIEVAGAPSDFADEAAAALLEYHAIDADMTMVASATMMIAAIDSDITFTKAAIKFARTFAPAAERAVLATAVAGTEQEVSAPPQPIIYRVPEGGSTKPESLERHVLDIESAVSQIVARVTSATETPVSLDGKLPEERVVPTSTSGDRTSRSPIQPAQVARGLRGELELMKRLQSAQGFAGLTLVRDCRKDGCGYDFLCEQPGGRQIRIELKTFEANGTVHVTPLEWEVARQSLDAYWLIGLHDNDGPPSTWTAYVIQDPEARLSSIGNWRIVADLEAPADALFLQIRETRKGP